MLSKMTSNPIPVPEVDTMKNSTSFLNRVLKELVPKEFWVSATVELIKKVIIWPFYIAIIWLLWKLIFFLKRKFYPWYYNNYRNRRQNDNSIELASVTIDLSFSQTSPLIQNEDSMTTQTNEQRSHKQRTIYKLYCFGGKTSKGVKTNTVSCLNFSTREWKNCKEMSYAADKLCGAKLGDKIYICGSPSSSSWPTLSMFDTTTESWSPLGKIPEPLQGCAAAELNGYIYITGGRGREGKPTALVFRYDIANGSWEKMPSMQMNRVSHQLVELNNQLYAICGWLTPTIERFDPETGLWTFVAEANYPHSYAGATTHQGRIYVYSYEGFEVYTPETDTWEKLTRFYNFGVGPTLVSVGDKVWTLGGGQFESPRSDIFEYNPDTGKWFSTKLRMMDISRNFHCSFVVTE